MALVVHRSEKLIGGEFSVPATVRSVTGSVLPTHAGIVFLGDIHNDPEMPSERSALIRQIALARGIGLDQMVFLVEGVPAGEKVSLEEFVAQHFLGPEIVEEAAPLQIYGWEQQELYRLSIDHLNLLKMLIISKRRLKGCIDLLEAKRAFEEVEENREKEKELKLQIEELKPAIETLNQKMIREKEIIKEFAKKRTEFMCQVVTECKKTMKPEQMLVVCAGEFHISDANVIKAMEKASLSYSTICFNVSPGLDRSEAAVLEYYRE